MSSETEIRSFRVDMPDEAIADLRRRIAATRWPSKELVADRSQGVQLATPQTLARYWAAEYDWRVVTAFPVPEYRAEAITAFETAIAWVHGEPGVELYALHEGRDRLVMVEKYESERARAECAKGAARPACGPLWTASSAAVSTRGSVSRTRPETRRRACRDRSP